MKKHILILVAVIILSITANEASAQRMQPTDSLMVSVPGITEYKKDRTVGKAIQMVGAAAIGTYFFMVNNYEKKIEDGNLSAKRPGTTLPIIGSGLLMIGFSIDMGAIKHILKKRGTKRPVKISTENYKF